MERNLVSPCDVSPIQPKQLREAENQKPGLNMEKLLLERVMLRKELKLRNMQERLLDQTQKLEAAQEKLAEYEAMPGLAQVIAVSKLGRDIWELGRKVYKRGQRGASCSVAILYQIIIFITCNIPSHILQRLPACVQVGCMSMVQGVARWVGDTAQNYDNECRERGEERKKDERVDRRRRRSRI